MRWLPLLLLAVGCASSTESDSGSVTCVDTEGVRHEVGESWDAGDGCNTCSCESDGSASCTELGCL